MFPQDAPTATISQPQDAGSETASETIPSTHAPTANPQEAARLTKNALANTQSYAEHCGRGSIVGVSRVTGHVVVVPMCCKSWTCPTCARRMAKRWAARVVAAKPTRFITLTVDPKLFGTAWAAYDALKSAFKQMVALWRREHRKNGKVVKPAKTFEYFAIWEMQRDPSELDEHGKPGTGMPHLHILQKGDYIPQPWMKAFMKRAGIGEICDVREILKTEKAAAYVTKYAAKCTERTKSMLGRNRLVTASAHFFEGATPPPPKGDYSDYDWTFANVAASYVVCKLLKTYNYLLVEDAFPYVLKMMPGPESQDVLSIEALAYELDPAWENKLTDSFPDTS